MSTRMLSWFSLTLFIVVTTRHLACTPTALGQTAKEIDVGAIEQAFGHRGELQDGVYKLSLPRTDLTVTVRNVKIRPGLALGSWLAFKKSGDQTIVDGDLVLVEEEVLPVLQKLDQHGIELTALHNHLVGESPRVMYLHFMGVGMTAPLAMALREVLSLTKTPLGETARSAGTEEPDFDAEQIQQIIGHRGKTKGGVLHVSIPRAEQITNRDVVLPPSMGMATVLNIQAGGEKKLAATGDFVLTQDEVQRVSEALTEHDVLITALHNHLVHGSPPLFFLHFWAHQPPENVAKGLKAALDAMK